VNIAAIILGILPSFAWLVFYLREDMHPEPKRLIFLTFLWGGVFAFFALYAQLFISCFYHDASSSGIGGLRFNCDYRTTNNNDLFGEVFPNAVLFILIFALIEELVKFAAAYLTVHKNPAFDEPVDAMIYAVTAALGFAAIENLGLVGFGVLSGTGAFPEAIYHISLRFVGATLLHAITSGVMGYYWARSIRQFGATRPIIWGLTFATILHALFNYLIIYLAPTASIVILLFIAGLVVLHDFEELRKETV